MYPPHQHRFVHSPRKQAVQNRLRCGIFARMKLSLYVPVLLAVLAGACQAQNTPAQDDPGARAASTETATPGRLLEEVFTSEASTYAVKAKDAFAKLTDAQRVAQLIVSTGGRLGKSQDELRKLTTEGVIGGVIYLANDLEDHRRQVAEIKEAESDKAPVPFWYSIDAEPSLIGRRIVGGPAVTAAADLRDAEQTRATARVIDSLIKDLGYHWNFAPVVDLGTENAAIKNRSFGRDAATVAERAIAYIEQTQADGIMACVKHFPGHGLVVGDTHKGSVVIDGEFEEYEVYERVLAKADPLSLMVGHINVRNNEYDTQGLPASLSRRITHDLVRDKLGYDGIVVTDALNMMAAATKYGDAGALMASQAGADVILMPADERLTHRQILSAMAKDEAYRAQVYRSVDRVLRAKAWLGLL